MYTSPSKYAAEVGDHDVTVHDGRIHLHYLVLPSHDVVGHAVSEDGLTFIPAVNAIRTGEPGECDDDQIWTMHTVQNPENGLYHMYYTAISLAEHGELQRVALATSEDLIHWTKHDDNPVCTADLPHYNGTMDKLGRVAFRDPFVYIEDGVWHLFVTASTADGDRLRSGCVSHATSTDGIQWEQQKPLYAPAHMDDLEVPSLLKHDGRYYLFIHQFRTPYSHYRVADSLDGPWIAPDYDELLPPHNAVFRFCEWEGETILYTWYRCAPDWKRRMASYASILPPKQVNFESDGTIRLSSFKGWRRYHRGEPTVVTTDDLQTFQEGPAAWEKQGDRIAGAVVGQMVAAAPQSFDDFVMETNVRLDEGRALGIVFRGSDDFEDGNWIRLDFARNRVELHHLTARDSGYYRFVRAQPSLKQTFDFELSRGEELHLKLIASREYIELSINDRIAISSATYAQTEGRFGVFIENGKGSFSPLSVQPIDPPKSGG